MNQLKSFLRLIIFSAFVVYISACSDKSKIEVESTNMGEEIDLQQNLVFTFENDVVPDSLINIWMNEEFVQIVPKVSGKFKWLSKNELSFSPDHRFAPSTDYEAQITKKLELVSEFKASIGEVKTYQFHTPYLNLSNTNVFWAKNTQNRSITEARLTLEFNYDVNVLDVKNKLHIIIDGKERGFDLTTSGVSNTILVAVAEQNEKYDNKSLRIVVDKGLKCAESNYICTQPIVFETTIPSKDNFQIIGVEAVYQESDAMISVNANQALLEGQDFNKLIKISPALSFTVELTESGCLIKGDFKESQSYDLEISKELRGIFEGKLKDNFQQMVVFGEQKPNISFVHKKGIYLTSKGDKNVAVRIINVPKVKVSLHKIYSNNILSFLKSSGMLYSYYEEEDDYYIYEDNLSEYGDVIYEKEITTSNLKKSNGTSLLDLNFNDINDFRGIYVISVSSTEDNWIKSTKVISISDIGLMVKQTENEVMVMANSIITTEPQSEIEVSLISSNNQEILKATTDKDGVAKFQNIKQQMPGFNVKMVAAKSKTDFTYLHFDQSRTENSRYDIGGVRNNPSGYQAYIYGDRNIYRPGETIYLNTIVRNDQWEVLKDAPIKVKLIMPNGKEFAAKKGSLNKQGAFQTSFVIPSNLVTGLYIVEVYTGNDVLLNTRQINIEDFMPDRIKVTTALNKTDYLLSDKVLATATALNLFGPPAADRNYQMEFSIRRKEFYSQQFADYNFALNGNVKASFEDDLREGTTDANGKAVEELTLLKEYQNSGLLEGRAVVTVFDESGRPVHSMKKFDIITQNIFLGIKGVDRYVATQQPLVIPLIALNKDAKPIANSLAKVEIIRNEWQTVMEKQYDGYRYVSQRKEIVIEQKTVSINGTSSNYVFKPNLSGEYEIRLSLLGADSYVVQEFYAYGWGATSNSSFEVNREGSIDIVMDKTSYEAGEKANILFKTPFAGKLMITVERDKVFEYYTLQTDKRSASLSLEVKENYLPNVYITATLIKPITDNIIPLTVAHGFAPLMAEKKSYQIPVTITAAKSSRSSTKQRIMIQAGNSSDIELTVAVVDEGILQLKRMESPDPYKFFFQKRALEVNSYDIYPKLLPEFRKSSVGGDGYDLEKRVNPLSNKRVKLVSFWSGALRTNGEGKAYYDVDIPQFSGDLRVMAVAYKDKAFGSATSNMKVADPIVISTSLPRFLSPGDSMLVNVTLSNTTQSVVNGVLNLRSNGLVSVTNQSTQKVSIKPNSEQQIRYKAYAVKAIGASEIVTEFAALNEKFVEKNSITVRPASSLQKTSTSGVVVSKQSLMVATSNDYIPSSTKTKLLVSKSPIVQFTKNINELIGYPHGCVEQTVSKAFPQLYFADIARSISVNAGANTQAANYYVQEAINKLQSMQLPNGALSYWQGGYEESWWGTIYVTHFLAEARKAGFEVSTRATDKMYNYMQEKLRTKATYTYYYYDRTHVTKQRPIAAKEIFYSLYIMASVGKQDISTMNYYKSNLSLLSLDARYLLAATYKLLGDNNSYRTLLPASFEGEESLKASGGSFYSYVRDMAIALNVLVETDPNNPQVAVLARHLSMQLKKEQYLSTQEMSFSLLALGKLANRTNKENATGQIAVDGKLVANFSGADIMLKQNLSNKKVTITSTSGNLYYFWDVEGLSVSGDVKEEDNYLKVRRTFYDRNGSPISGNTFKQNDLIVVKVSLETTDHSSVENVVITDILPAGFEIENPRLNDVGERSWIKNASTPQYLDVRDDRINLFTSATGITKEFYYTVRAVSKGNFKMGPVSADAMYNGEYHSYYGAGTIQVR